MRKIALFLSLTMIVFLSACSSAPTKPVIIDKEASGFSEEAEVVSAPSRESVFVYGNRKNAASHLILTLTGEPVLLPSGYVRLAGVVSGGRKTACVEIGGRGLALEEGEVIDDYRIVRINYDNVVLERGK